MLRFILIILVALYFGIPFLYEQALATETKIIKMNGQEWLVTIEPGKEPMLKPLEKPRAKVTKLPFIIHGEKKTEVAMKQFRDEIDDKSLKYFVIAGGVAANETIRKGLKEVSLKMNFKPIFPSKEFCGDNAAMIAWAGIQRFKKKLFNKKNETVKSRWPLDVKAPFLKGPGLKF